MSRYTDILAGGNIVEIRENEAGFNYYGYVRSDGSWVIMRETIATQTFLYAVGGPTKDDDFDTAFTARASKNYKKPSAYKFV